MLPDPVPVALADSNNRVFNLQSASLAAHMSSRESIYFMPKLLGTYLAVFVTMFVIDMLWLGVIAKSTYANAMGPLLSPKPNLWAAGAFYLLFPLGLVIFAVLPQADSPVWKAALMGALFGFFAYATYDLTNLAVVKDWPLGLTFIDMAWGTMVSGVAALVGKLALDYLNR